MSALRVLACWLAISVGTQAQQYVFRAYRQTEGLKDLSANSVTLDRQGFPWVATQNGVFRFLGSTFQAFGREQGLAEPLTNEILADSNGTLWAGTDENLYRWDGQRFVAAQQQPIPIPGKRIMAVEDSGHLLIADKSRLYRLEHDAAGKMLSYTPVFSAQMVAAIPELGQVRKVSVVGDPSAERRIWLSCGKKLVSLAEIRIGTRMAPGDGAVEVLGKEEGLPEDLWEGVQVDHTGTLWVAGQSHILVRSRGSARFVDRSIPGSDPGRIHGHAPLVEDPQGRMLAVADGGVARWDGTRWQLIGRANGLTHSSRITGMVFDSTGDLWLSSDGGGVYLWTGYGNWEGWGEGTGLSSETIWSIAPGKDDRVFIGTDQGPAWVDVRSGKAGMWPAQSKWRFGQVAQMGVNPDGSLWAGTFSGNIMQIDTRTGKAERKATISDYILDGLANFSGDTFFTTANGLWESDAKTAIHRVTAVDALLGSFRRIETGCLAPDGTTWFLTQNRLLQLRNGSWTEPPIDGLPASQGSLIALACAADGSVWSTGEQIGIWRFIPDRERIKAWRLEPPAAMQSLTPLSILVDRRGWVWLGTDLGLLVWNGSSWRQLTQESGLIWNDTNQGSLKEGPDGSIWVGTSGGLAHLQSPEQVFNSIPLPLSLSSIQWGSKTLPIARSITIPWASTTLGFQVASPAMRNRSDLSFKLRMEGRHPEWVESKMGRTIFTSLPPGDYTFMAMALNPSLNATSETLQVQVHILVPWWRSYWFYSLCGIALLFLLAAADRLRARHLKGKSIQLESLISERTRELEMSREQLRIQATHDGLTGMLNRTGILRMLAIEMDRARRESRTLVVALVDLDHFKHINDTYGHLAGDEALRWFAAAVGAAIRPYDHAGRYGGEEFLLLLTEIPQEITEQRLAKLHSSITALRVRRKGTDFNITCSIGATVFNPTGPKASGESLLALADQALYAAKAAGRNCLVFRMPKDAKDSAGSPPPA